MVHGKNVNSGVVPRVSCHSSLLASRSRCACVENTLEIVLSGEASLLSPFSRRMFPHAESAATTCCLCWSRTVRSLRKFCVYVRAWRRLWVSVFIRLGMVAVCLLRFLSRGAVLGVRRCCCGSSRCVYLFINVCRTGKSQHRGVSIRPVVELYICFDCGIYMSQTQDLRLLQDCRPSFCG